MPVQDPPRKKEPPKPVKPQRVVQDPPRKKKGDE